MKGLNLAEWAIKHKPVVYFFIFFILLGGLWSYFHLGRSEDPDFTIRQAVVSADASSTRLIACVISAVSSFCSQALPRA